MTRITGIDRDQLLASYDYELPADLIAQTPVIPRDSSRLLVVDSPTNHTNSLFCNLPDFLLPGDLLVLNNTRVIPARLYGRKPTGGLVEVLLLEERENNCWLALAKPGRRLKPGAKILFEAHTIKGTGKSQQGTVTGLSEDCYLLQTPFPLQEEASELEKREPEKTVARSPFPVPSEATASVNSGSTPNRLTATVLERDESTGGRLLKFEVPEGVSFRQLLEQFGQMPLPPYITASQSQPEQYQTVYAEQLGAVAAPTAGLHFTEELLKQLHQRGIEQVYITLHVGVGTFRQVEVENITDHKIHEEWVEVSARTVEKIRETQAKGGRIIAVGTTVARSLEASAASGELQSYCGMTQLFIYPGYQWRVVEGLITNFHLPRSSLLMLVSAMVGRQRLFELYKSAIAHQYRFYSFGDAMLILPQAKSY